MPLTSLKRSTGPKSFSTLFSLIPASDDHAASPTARGRQAHHIRLDDSASSPGRELLAKDDCAGPCSLSRRFVLLASRRGQLAHRREEDHVAQRLLIGQEDGKTVYADADATGRRHPVHQGVDVVLVDRHCLFIAGGVVALLIDETR